MSEWLGLVDIDVHKPSAALAAIMLTAPGLRMFLHGQGTEFAHRYSAIVARKTGQLAESPVVSVVIGGHEEDRQVCKVMVGGPTVVNVSGGKPFFYGVLHDLGSPTKREEFPAAKDLREAMESMKA